MKFYFIIINIMLAMLGGVVGYLHFKHRPPKKAAVLAAAPTGPDNKDVKGLFHLPPPFEFKTTALIQERNLFDPKRGVVEVADDTPPPPEPIKDNELELVGICKLGGFSAAIIDVKKTLARIKPKTPGEAPGARVGPAPGKPRLYREGAELPNGFVVKKIEFDKVTLGADGAQEYILAMNRDDDFSSKRKASVPARKPAAVGGVKGPAKPAAKPAARPKIKMRRRARSVRPTRPKK